MFEPERKQFPSHNEAYDQRKWGERDSGRYSMTGSGGKKEQQATRPAPPRGGQSQRHVVVRLRARVARVNGVAEKPKRAVPVMRGRTAKWSACFATMVG